MAGRITRLKVQARNKERVNVYLDGEFAFGLAAITAGWLSVGQELSDEQIAGLRAADSHEAVYAKALRFLSYRPRSEAEVRKYLRGKGLEAEVGEPVILRLKRAGLLDDEAFARSWVEDREEFRPRSRRAVAAELRQKGLAGDVIESVLEGLDEEQSATRAAQSRARRLKGLPWPEFRNKLGGYLSRRGFSYGVISPVVEQAWQMVNEDNGTQEIEGESEE